MPSGDSGVCVEASAAHWAQRRGQCQRAARVRCVIELGAAWIPHKAQHHSKPACVKSDNGHTNHEVTFAMTSYGNLKKSPPKPLMQRVHYIVERALWVAGNPAQTAGYILSNMPKVHWKQTKTGIQDPSWFTESGIVCAFAWHQQGWDRGRASWWRGHPMCLPFPWTFQLPWPIFTQSLFFLWS